MRVHEVKVSGTTLTGVVGDFELWFRVDAETELNASADPFVAAALLPSMLAGSDIEVDGAVSGQLLRISRTCRMSSIAGVRNSRG